MVHWTIPGKHDLCPGRHNILPRKHNVYIFAEFKIANSAEEAREALINQLDPNLTLSQILHTLSFYWFICSLYGVDLLYSWCLLQLNQSKNDSLEKNQIFGEKCILWIFSKFFLTILSFQGHHDKIKRQNCGVKVPPSYVVYWLTYLTTYRQIYTVDTVRS